MGKGHTMTFAWDADRERVVDEELEHPFTSELRLGANIQALSPNRKLEVNPVGFRALIDAREPDVLLDVVFCEPLSVACVGETGVGIRGRYRVECAWIVNKRSGGMIADGYALRV